MCRTSCWDSPKPASSLRLQPFICLLPCRMALRKLLERLLLIWRKQEGKWRMEKQSRTESFLHECLFVNTFYFEKKKSFMSNWSLGAGVTWVQASVLHSNPLQSTTKTDSTHITVTTKCLHHHLATLKTWCPSFSVSQKFTSKHILTVHLFPFSAVFS